MPKIPATKLPEADDEIVSFLGKKSQFFRGCPPTKCGGGTSTLGESHNQNRRYQFDRQNKSYSQRNHSGDINTSVTQTKDTTVPKQSQMHPSGVRSSRGEASSLHCTMVRDYRSQLDSAMNAGSQSGISAAASSHLLLPPPPPPPPKLRHLSLQETKAVDEKVQNLLQKQAIDQHLRRTTDSTATYIPSQRRMVDGIQ